MFDILINSSIKIKSVPDESILSAVIDGGLLVPHSCKIGRCNACKCKVISGSTRLIKEEMGLTESEKERGWILACVRAAVSDVSIMIDKVSQYLMPPVILTPARIASLERSSESVIMVRLRIPVEQNFKYYPGQYIDVIRGGLRRSYSIANAYIDSGQLELHIKKYDSGAMSNYWFHDAKVNDLLRINGPFGSFFLKDAADKDLILLATGTGFAPIKAILEGLMANNSNQLPRTIKVYWGGREKEDFYTNVPDIGIHYEMKYILSRNEKGDHLEYVQYACLKDISDMNNKVVFACGSPAMINDAKRIFVESGLDESNFHSDAFVCTSN